MICPIKIKSQSRIFMDTSTRNALIGGGIGALAGGVGGHLVDRKAKRDGSWLNRNKGAIIGGLGGGALGAGAGYFLTKKNDVPPQSETHRPPSENRNKSTSSNPRGGSQDSQWNSKNQPGRSEHNYVKPPVKEEIHGEYNDLTKIPMEDRLKLKNADQIIRDNMDPSHPSSQIQYVAEKDLKDYQKALKDYHKGYKSENLTKKVMEAQSKYEKSLRESNDNHASFVDALKTDKDLRAKWGMKSNLIPTKIKRRFI